MYCLQLIIHGGVLFFWQAHIELLLDVLSLMHLNPQVLQDADTSDTGSDTSTLGYMTPPHGGWTRPSFSSTTDFRSPSYDGAGRCTAEGRCAVEASTPSRSAFSGFGSRMLRLLTPKSFRR